MATRRGQLKAVPAETAQAPKQVVRPRRRPRTLKAAVELSERDVLATIRQKIAEEIDGGVPPHTLAPLSRQLREVDKEIRLFDIRAQQQSEEDGAATGDEAWDSSAI